MKHGDNKEEYFDDYVLWCGLPFYRTECSVTFVYNTTTTILLANMPLEYPSYLGRTTSSSGSK